MRRKPKQRNSSTKTKKSTAVLNKTSFMDSESSVWRDWTLQEGVEYLQKLTADDQDEFQISSHFVITKNASFKQFCSWVKWIGDKKPFRFRWNTDESIEIYELPSPQHEATTVAFSHLLLTAFSAFGCISGSPKLGNNVVGMGEPDSAFTPDGLPPVNPPISSSGMAWPTVILEVGWTESHNDLISDKNWWLAAGTAVQIVIIIRIFGSVGNAIPPSVPMLAMQFVRGVAAPTQVISFGTRPLHYATVGVTNALGPITGVLAAGGACNAPALPAFQIQLPTALVFTGVPIPAVLAGFVNISLDLYAIQQNVLKVFRN